MGGGDFDGEFDGGVAGVKVVDEGKEGHKAMLSYEEDVVYEPFPQEGKEVVCIDVEFFESMHVGDCIVESGSGAHSGTTCLEEVSTTEGGEIVALSTSSRSFLREVLVGCWAPGQMVSRAWIPSWIPSALGILV